MRAKSLTSGIVSLPESCSLGFADEDENDVGRKVGRGGGGHFITRRGAIANGDGDGDGGCLCVEVVVVVFL